MSSAFTKLGFAQNQSRSTQYTPSSMSKVIIVDMIYFVILWNGMTF